MFFICLNQFPSSRDDKQPGITVFNNSDKGCRISINVMYEIRKVAALSSRGTRELIFPIQEKLLIILSVANAQ